MRRQEPDEFDRTHDKRWDKLYSLGDAVFGHLGSGENHERAVLRDLLGKLDLNGVHADPVGYAEHPENVFSQLQEQGAGSLLTVKDKQQSLVRKTTHLFYGSGSPDQPWLRYCLGVSGKRSPSESSYRTMGPGEIALDPRSVIRDVHRYCGTVGNGILTTNLEPSVKL
jgi:hypothetical protein